MILWRLQSSDRVSAPERTAPVSRSYNWICVRKEDVRRCY